jgi:hypothetical protein
MFQCNISRIHRLESQQTFSPPTASPATSEAVRQNFCKNAFSRLVQLSVQIAFTLDARPPSYIPLPMQMLS